MTDMKKAGLNPILAGKMGGASTPAGASFQSQNTALAGIQATANIMNTIANTNKTSQETKILKDTSGSILGKTIDAVEKLIKGDSNVSDFIQGKSLTKFMKGTAIDDFLRDITNAKEATTDKVDSPSTTARRCASPSSSTAPPTGWRRWRTARDGRRDARATPSGITR